MLKIHSLNGPAVYLAQPEGLIHAKDKLGRPTARQVADDLEPLKSWATVGGASCPVAVQVLMLNTTEK